MSVGPRGSLREATGCQSGRIVELSFAHDNTARIGTGAQVPIGIPWAV